MTDQLDDRTYDLLFGIQRSVRYHHRRRRFYEIWNTITVACAVLGGSSAATAFLAGPSAEWSWLPAAFAGIVALLGAVDLAVGTARQANLHGDLARQFISLEQRFAHGRNLDDVEHEDLVKARLSVEASEPPVLRLLDVMCHFELLRSKGDDPAQWPSISWLRCKFAHWLSQSDYAVSLREKTSEA